MHTKKKIIAWIYYWLLRLPLLAMAKWPEDIEKYLGYCCRGCENCYAWRCSARKTGQTPYGARKETKRLSKQTSTNHGARVLETNDWRGGDLIVSGSPDVAELCALVKAWSPMLAEAIGKCMQAKDECDIIGDVIAGEQVTCSKCGFDFEDIINGTAAWIEDHIAFCPGCGRRIRR